MIIGVPKETKIQEHRVGLTPTSVRELITFNHQILVETNAGLGIGFSDQDYQAAGATILDQACDIFAQAEFIIKVKEPNLDECLLLKPGQTLFTYLHLAPNLALTKALIASQAVCLAYETVSDNNGGLPLLAPMSAVAGRMAIQAGAQALEKVNHGAGILLGGVPGVAAANVVIIGGGIVGTNAASMAIGLGADVTVLDRNINSLKRLEDLLGHQVQTIYSTTEAIDYYVTKADLVIGSVLIPGAAAPKLVNKSHIQRMKKGSAIVDVAIDQGGCFETSKPTTHADPTYLVDGVVHYCVANMPGAVPKTATMALNNATLPFIIEIANKGYQQALLENVNLLKGLNVFNGQITNQQVAEHLSLEYVDAGIALLN